METKICSKCGVVLPLLSYSIRADRPHLREGRCKKCINFLTRRNRGKRIEESRAYFRARYAKHRYLCPFCGKKKISPRSRWCTSCSHLGKNKGVQNWEWQGRVKYYYDSLCDFVAVFGVDWDDIDWEHYRNYEASKFAQNYLCWQSFANESKIQEIMDGQNYYDLRGG